MIGSWNDDGAGFDSHDDVPAPKASEHRPWCKTKEVEYRLGDYAYDMMKDEGIMVNVNNWKKP